MTAPSNQALSFYCGNDYADSRYRANLTATIYIAVGSVSFPHESWSDFPLILDWWLRELREFRESNEKIVILQFMDGPYKAKFSRSDASFLVSFYRDSENLTKDLAGIENLEIDFNLSEQNLISLAQKVITEAEAAGLGRNNGIENIRISLDATIKSLTKIPFRCP